MYRLPFDVLDQGALAAAHEQRLVEADARIARTGELTPPGISRWARS